MSSSRPAESIQSRPAESTIVSINITEIEAFKKYKLLKEEPASEQKIKDLLRLFSVDEICTVCKKYIDDVDADHSKCVAFDYSECAICTDEIGLSLPLSCNHLFCIECLLHARLDTCPNCRAPITEVNLLAAKPKPTPENDTVFNELDTIDNGQFTELMDFVGFILETLANGIIVSPRMRMALPNTLMESSTVTRIVSFLMHIPGVLIQQVNGNQRGEWLINTERTDDISEMMCLILNTYYSSRTTDEQRRYIYESIWNIGLMNEAAGYTFNMISNGFNIELRKSFAVVVAGEIEFKKTGDEFDFRLVEHDKKKRFLELKGKNFELLQAKNATLKESMTYIRESVSDVMFISTAPFTDMEIVGYLKIIMINLMRHVLKWYSAETIKECMDDLNAENMKNISFIPSLKLMECSLDLLAGKCVDINFVCYSILKSIKNHLAMLIFN